MVTDPITNLGESPVLQPLKQFGFNIYSGPALAVSSLPLE
jgi:hypothetical protein